LAPIKNKQDFFARLFGDPAKMRNADYIHPPIG
jgi:hypothetical protein